MLLNLAVGAFITAESVICIYCYFGVKTTESYENMASDLYESNWPDLPVKLQKYCIVMIANMQRPVYYHGFNICNLDLEIFVVVRKSSIQMKFKISNLIHNF